jgi:hypothetical protein
MVMQLIPLMVGIAIAIIVAIALFSVFPTIMGSFTCPAITGDTDGDFVKDSGETFTESAAVVAWKQSCNQVQTQTTIVPVLLALAIVIAAIILVTRMFA